MKEKIERGRIAIPAAGCLCRLDWGDGFIVPAIDDSGCKMSMPSFAQIVDSDLPSDARCGNPRNAPRSSLPLATAASTNENDC